MIQTNPKSWWHIARQFIGKTKCSNIPAMQCGDAILVENREKAENFNNAFLKFATINTSNASLPDIAYRTNSRLSSINVTQAETLDILKSLDTSKASGPDGISCKMLKETADSIAPSFTRLLQLSLSTATVPGCWKQANVLPLFKTGDGQILVITDPFHFLIFVQRSVKKSYSSIYSIIVEIMTLSLFINLALPLVTQQCIS